MKLYPGEFTVLDLLSVARSKAFRTAVTPFGHDATYHRYAGRAVAWKFVPHAENAPERVKAGLSKAKEISKRHHEKGVDLILLDGKEVMVPHKVTEMCREAGREVKVLASGRTAAEIITAVRAVARAV